MAPQASKKCGLLPPNHLQISWYTSNGINSEQVSGTFSMLTMSTLAPQVSAQGENGCWHLYFAHRSLHKPQYKERALPDTIFSPCLSPTVVHRTLNAH